MLSRAQGELRWLKSIKPKQRKNLNFQLKATEKASMEIADLDEASLTFDGLERPILNDVRVGISKGQRIGIVGGNGAGKTTLLRVIIGEILLILESSMYLQASKLVTSIKITELSNLMQRPSSKFRN